MFEKNQIVLLIIQAMQLPVIALLVIFSIRASNAGKIFSRNNISLGNDGIHRNDSPLIYPEIGFILNLFLISIEILKNVILLDEDILLYLKLVLGSLITAFFLLGSMLYFIGKKRRISKFERVVYLITIPICFTVLYLLLNENLSILTNVIDFVVFSFTTSFIFAVASIRNAHRVSYYSNYFVFVGFAIWTTLQLLPIVQHFGIDLRNIQLIGYSGSAIAKGFILFGLYNFSIRVADYSQEEILIQNRHAKETSLRLEQVNKSLEENSSKLKDLNKLINEIASCNDNDKVIEKMIDHLINSKLFRFDYAIFSRVDYIKDRILHTRNHAKYRNGSDLNNVCDWVRAGGVPIGHHDIMSQVVVQKKPSRVIGDMVDGFKNDFTSPYSILDKAIYNRYEHHRLDRLFVPVSNFDIFSPGINDLEKGLTIGVLELGFNRFSDLYIEGKIEENRELLSIYSNNIAQTYMGNLLMEENAFIENFVRELSEKEMSRDEYHVEFIDKVFRKCADELMVNCGEFSFLSLDNAKMMTNSSTYGSIDSTEYKRVREINLQLDTSQRKKGIFNHVAENRNGYYSNDVECDKYYIPGIADIKSQLSVPFKYNETVLGVVSLYSFEKNFFSERKLDYAQRFFNASAGTFLRLKLSFAVGSLVLPYSIYDKGSIYKATCERLSKYFASSFVTMWESYDVNSKSFSLTYATEKKELSLSRFRNVGNFAEDICEFSDPRVASIDETVGHNISNAFENHASSLGFRAIIYIPIRKYKRKSRFAAILSRRAVNDLFPEDKAFCSHISNKFLMSITFFDVYNFFDRLTKERYDRGTDTILDDFLPMIREITGADIVLLFNYNQHEKKFYKAISFPNESLADTRLVERLNSAEITANDFSHSIIRNGTQWIENEAQYSSYREMQTEWKGWDVFQNDFWHRERVKSLAAMKIEFDEEELGVLFLNFREEQHFDIDAENKLKSNSAIENRKLINLLANLIGRVIKISGTLQQDRDYLIEKSKESALLARSEVAIGMIHNIINLASILSLRYGLLSKSIQKANLDDEEILENLRHLNEGITLIVNDYLIYREYFISAEFKLEVLNVRELFKDVEIILKYQIPNSGNAKLLVSEVAPGKIIYCDKVQFSHVMLNLVKNAMEASATNIIIRFLEADSTGQYSVIEIQDNGTGIKEEHRAKIFLPSFTSKKFGTGMGLPVSQDVIKNHGGRIDFKSLYNKGKQSGSIFSIYLPIKRNH